MKRKILLFRCIVFCVILLSLSYQPIIAEKEVIQLKEVIEIIEEYNTPPEVNIISPTIGLYLFNNKIMDLSYGIIAIGSINFIVEASDDESGIYYVECEFVRMSTISTIVLTGEQEQYVFTLSTLSLGRWFVTVTAYDIAGNSAFDKIEIWKFF
jgi:hypothetical protein